MASIVTRLSGAVLIVLSAFAAAHGAIGVTNFVFDRRLDTEVGSKRLLKTPAWTVDSPNPPVAVRKAIRLATAMKERLVNDTNKYHWQFIAARLCRDPEVDRWYWKIRFEADVRPGQPPDYIQELDIVVLMDGITVKPTITAGTKNGAK